MPRPWTPEAGPALRASLRNRNAHATFHKRHQKSHFILKFKKKMPRPRLGTEGRHTLLRASLRNQNACPHVTRDIRRATFYGNLQEKCHVPDWAQNANTHFARACAVEMHVKYGQCRCKPTKSATTKTYILTVGLVFCIVFLAAFIT